METTPIIIFDGEEFRLAPSGRYFKACHGKYRNKFLHRVIWEFYTTEKIPKDYVIHHKNHNKLDNRFENLECISPKQHSEIHLKGKKPDKNRQKILQKMWKNSRTARSTPEYKKKHSEHCKKWFNANKKVNCSVCQKEFIGIRTQSHLCSQECRRIWTNKWSRERSANRPLFTKKCIYCEKEFTAKDWPCRKQNSITCSRKCARLYGHKRSIQSHS